MIKKILYSIYERAIALLVGLFSAFMYVVSGLIGLFSPSFSFDFSAFVAYRLDYTLNEKGEGYGLKFDEWKAAKEREKRIARYTVTFNCSDMPNYTDLIVTPPSYDNPFEWGNTHSAQNIYTKESLKKQIEIAIQKEDFEHAAMLRDIAKDKGIKL